ncbi:Intraflagellar transport protein 57 homolog, partial [Geodia barretti]
LEIVARYHSSGQTHWRERKRWRQRKKRDEEGEEGHDLSDNPLTAHLVVVRMENISDNLKLLDYERGFCKGLNFKPIPRHYFAVATNPGEQFHVFANLAVWLLNQCGRKLAQPEESDDPNSSTAAIMEEARKLKLHTDFPPHKLKTGCGEQVCSLLLGLTECALHSRNFKWRKPVYRDEQVEEEVVEGQSAEVTLDQLEEEIHEDVESEEEGDVFMDLSNMKETRDLEVEMGGALGGALEAGVDEQQWRLEVERVLPSLRVHLRQDNREWRAHYDQMHSHQEAIETKLADTKVYLDKLQQEIGRTLEKISSREKYVNNQLESSIAEFRTSQDGLAEIRERYRNSSSSVNDLARELAQVKSELCRRPNHTSLINAITLSLPFHSHTLISLVVNRATLLFNPATLGP